MSLCLLHLKPQSLKYFLHEYTKEQKLHTDSTPIERQLFYNTKTCILEFIIDCTGCWFCCPNRPHLNVIMLFFTEAPENTTGGNRAAGNLLVVCKHVYDNIQATSPRTHTTHTPHPHIHTPRLLHSQPSCSL